MRTADKALVELRDYFREVSALCQRRMDADGVTIQAAFALDAERGAYQHACEMVGSYLETLGTDDSRSAAAIAIDLANPETP